MIIHSGSKSADTVYLSSFFDSFEWYGNDMELTSSWCFESRLVKKKEWECFLWCKCLDISSTYTAGYGINVVFAKIRKIIWRQSWTQSKLFLIRRKYLFRSWTSLQKQLCVYCYLLEYGEDMIRRHFSFHFMRLTINYEQTYLFLGTLFSFI